MVCMDGFILTHAYERVDMPTQEQVDAYLPPYEPRQVLDPDEPVSIGAMVGPEAFMEVRYLAHAKQMQALELIPQLAAEFKTVFGRDSGGLVHTYRTEDAETIVVAMGSVLGTIKDTVDEMRDGAATRSACSASPLSAPSRSPPSRRAEALQARRRAGKEPGRRHRRHRRHQRAHGASRHGAERLHGRRRPRRPRDHHEVAARAVRQGETDDLDPVTFLDLDWKAVNKQLERESAPPLRPDRRNLLRDVGVVGARNY